MGDSTQACWDFAQAVADSLAMLGLELNADKTEVLDAVDARTEWFGRNPLGGYDDIAVDGSLTEEGALAVVLEHLPHDAPDPQRFPYALSALRASKNRDAVNTSSSRRRHWNCFRSP